MPLLADRRRLSWNPLITTPPGLYLASLAIILPASLLASDQLVVWMCDVRALRLLNSLALALAVIVIARLQQRLWILNGFRPESAKAAAVAINVVTFPVLFFTSTLYYTDLLSLVAVLLSLDMLKRQAVKSAAVVAAFSLLMRQTNIIWAAFGVGLLVHERLAIALRKKGDKGNKRDMSPWELLWTLWESFRARPKSTVLLLVNCVWPAWPFILLGMCGVGFVLWNGGIVLGDRTAHTAVFHAPQLFYFFAFSALFACPLLLNATLIRQILVHLRSHPLRLTLSAVSAVAVIHLFTYDHPYLLSDNRHYTFYIWRRWFMRHWSLKFVAAPAYVLAALAVAIGVRKQSAVWRMGFLLATIAVTVPNRLLEFRYFLIPYLIWRLHVDRQLQSWPRLALEFFLHVSINCVTLWMFLYRPFEWAHEPGALQRFMW
uniref:Dol-P-Glc:Glc(2)Man(9)GlcNAc(2)-PP-Dol alpha-1,2-glucosyltransferase n=1 Tax=Plectus sambesii TaxID=2011161 RepID=A0A914W6Y3_9BILA